MMNKSDNGFMTRVWGPMLWTVLHMISLNYPVEPTPQHQRQYKRFFRTLMYVLPCGACRKSYRYFILRHPVVKIRDEIFTNRETLSKWLFTLHNVVNHKLRKHQATNFQRSMNFYERFRAQCGKGSKDSKGCYTPVRGPRKRCIIRIVNLNASKGKRSVVCART